jgi:hypothetical protein
MLGFTPIGVAPINDPARPVVVLPYTDDFARLDALHVFNGGFILSSGKLQSNAAGLDSKAGTFITQADATATVTIPTLTGGYAGVIGRFSGTSGYVATILHDGHVQLWNYTAGYSLINDAYITVPALPFTLTLKAIGTALTVLINGVSTVTATDSTFTAAGDWGPMLLPYSTTNGTEIDSMVIATVAPFADATVSAVAKRWMWLTYQGPATGRGPTNTTTRQDRSWAARLVNELGATQYTQAVGGTLTPTGALAQRQTLLRSATGSSTPVGALTPRKAFLRSLSGSSTPSGALTRKTGKLVSGSSTPSALIVRKVGKLVSGSSTPSGVIAVRLTLIRRSSKLCPALRRRPG